jgi:hypothetical protein
MIIYILFYFFSPGSIEEDSLTCVSDFFFLLTFQNNMTKLLHFFNVDQMNRKKCLVKEFLICKKISIFDLWTLLKF